MKKSKFDKYPHNILKNKKIACVKKVIFLNNSKIRLTDADSDLTFSAADDLKLFT